MQKKVYVSGMHSGQNPCSGVGIARSLKKAFPDLTVVGVDHWQGSSGLHDTAIDETLMLPPWKQIDNERHKDEIRSILDAGNLWISALDMEVHWFADNFGRHVNLLAPSKTALELSAKPAVKALEGVGFKVPDYIPASLPDSDIHAFLRHNAWQCWLKSPYHDARRVGNWPMFEKLRSGMSQSWKTSRLFIQRHVVGNEETIAFTAHQGELVGAILMQKRQLTPEGKTWAAKVSQVDPELYEQLKEVVRRMEWSGGGEIEYAIDPDGQKWIIECNPRFPAWIYGGAISGMNLPAKLVSHIWKLPFLEARSRYPFFTRVVQEIPAKEAIGIPMPPDVTQQTWSSDGKKGAVGTPVSTLLPSFREAEEGDDPDKESELLPESISKVYIEEVDRLVRKFVTQSGDIHGPETPARIHLEEWTQWRFKSLVESTRAVRDGVPQIRLGYSVKTSPTDDHLRKAKKEGFFAECISQAEVKRALNFGYQPHEVILNGPGKFWPLTGKPVHGLHMLFCDSVEEFENVLEMPGIAKVLGFRMRIPKIASRFGNPLDDFDRFKKIIQCVKKLKGRAELGFHFHMPSWSIGLNRWTEALQSLVIWCEVLEKLSGVPVQNIDLGGGFFPGDLQRLDLRAVKQTISSTLSNVHTLYFEPGRSLTQDGEILVSRVLDVRKDTEGELTEVVVDACVAELPLALSFSHKTFYSPQPKNGAFESCQLLKKGDVRVLGRICMEDDILSTGLALPATTQIGDYVIFGDAGAYERTMSYVFGRG